MFLDTFWVNPRIPYCGGGGGFSAPSTPHPVAVAKNGKFGIPTKHVIILVVIATGWWVDPRQFVLNTIFLDKHFPIKKKHVTMVQNNILIKGIMGNLR